MRYARKYKGKIETFRQKPKILTTDSGSVMGLQNAEENTLAQYGILPVEIPQFNPKTHRLGDVYWDNDNSIFTREIISLNITLNDIKSELIQKLKADWKFAEEESRPYLNYMKDSNTPIPQDVENTVSTFFSFLTSTKEEIQAISTLQEALDYEYPESTIQQGLNYMKDLI
jgi:hypothetical protein